MTTAFVMAAIASITAIVSISGVLAGMVEANIVSAVIVGLGIIILTTITTTVGTGVAWAALKKGGPNPMGIWIALIWNVLLLAVIVLMMVLNTLMRGH